MRIRHWLGTLALVLIALLLWYKGKPSAQQLPFDPRTGRSYYIATEATLDFPEIVGDGCDTLTVSVPGAEVGHAVTIGVPATIPARSTFFAWVSAPGVISVKHCAHGGSPDPTSGTFYLKAFR